MLIKEHTAVVTEAVGCGAIIGAIAGILIGVSITGDGNAPVVEYFVIGGAILGGIITFVGGLIRDVYKIKRDLQKNKGSKAKTYLHLQRY